MTFRSRTAVCLLLLLLLGRLHAQMPQPVVPHAGLPGLRTVSVEQYRAHLQLLTELLDRCKANADACDADAVGDLDDFVHPATGASYIERYGWLRNLLADRNDPQHKRRAEFLPAAATRLREQIAEIDASPASTSLTARQQSQRTSVLDRREFRTVQEYSLVERLSAWLSDQFARLFGGFSRLGKAVPWLGTAVQWGALMLAASLLALWVYRALDRQRVALGKLHGDASAAARQAESRVWARQAEAHAERGEWREAVHALYWASIVILEDRRTLRRSGTRTPREALRLIDPASHLRAPLQAQTSDFERIWYGMKPAVQGDYGSALEHYRVLQAGSTGAARA